MKSRLRATGWNSALPHMVGERSVESDVYDRRLAKTFIPQRKWWKVPEGPCPFPCEVCGGFLEPGTSVHRRIVHDEALYRHPRCGRD